MVKLSITTFKDVVRMMLLVQVQGPVYSVHT